MHIAYSALQQPIADNQRNDIPQTDHEPPVTLPGLPGCLYQIQ